MKNSGLRFFIGMLFILFGIVYLLDNLNVIYYDLYLPHWVLSWRTVFLLLGIVLVSSSKNKTLGIIFILIGGIPLLTELTHYRFGEMIREFWPILLIILGIYILYQRNVRLPSVAASVPGADEDIIDHISIFGGGKKKIQSKNFRGGKVTAIFGGSEINLLESELAQGNNYIHIFAMFGGTTFIVQRNWNVVVDVTPILGGFSDERIQYPDIEKQTDRTLIIKGLVLFGGGEVKN